MEYPSESGAPLSGEEGGEPPPPTTVHWDLGGHLRRCAAPAQVVSLALAISSTVEDLPTCWGALPTTCTKESDSPAFTTGILGAGFSAQLLSLWRSEAATAHHHASIRGRRLMVKWAECKIHPEKPPPCEPGLHTRYPSLNPNGPACHKRTNKPSPGHPLACAPAP